MSSEEDSAQTQTELPARVGLRTRILSDERLAFCKQIGVDDVFIDHRQPRGDVFDDEINQDDITITVDEGTIPSTSELTQARQHAANAGVRLMGIQSLSPNIYEKIMLGKEGEETQLKTIKQLIRNLGHADIPILGYQWNPWVGESVILRTSQTSPVRGGAKARSLNADELEESVTGVEQKYTEKELWENYEKFLNAVLPVAEEAGVRLALHPADPPAVKQLGGVPRLFRNVEAFERAMKIVPSDNHGLKLCLGCFSEMPDVDVETVVRKFGERDDIVFIHFRNVIGTWPSFSETFVDDPAGNFDARNLVKVLREVEFDGVMVPDHVPDVVGDTEWGHRSRAMTVGHLNGLLSCDRDAN